MKLNAKSGGLLGCVVLAATTGLFYAADAPSPVFEGPKIKGVCSVAPHKVIDETAFETLRKINAEWVAVVPYGFCKENDPHFYFDSNWQWWGETSVGAAKTIELAHKAGLKAMLKPHVWVQKGTYTGDFDLKTEPDWQIFEKDFARYVLRYAHIADSTQADLYCIATEMDNFVLKRPAFWHDLILKVRKIYHGKLTYADNWDKYTQNPLWQDLDFIGIDAYFPLTENTNPTPRDLDKGWKAHLLKIEKFAQITQKPVLFTEFGYRNIEGAAVRPWESYKGAAQNDRQQAEAYESLFRNVWHKPWFAGGLAWKWFLRPDMLQRSPDDYTPQGKPAEAVLQKWFAR